jgi:type VI secretion system secreted protein Hcp
MKARKLFFAIVVLGIALVFCSQDGWAAIPVYMEIESDSGPIEGSCTRQGREGNIVVYSFGHNVTVPIDPQSGISSGTRRHNPLKILKEIDKSSPKLFQALCTGETLRSVTLKFYQINPSGQEEHYFTILLENAIITSITPSFPTAFLSENQAYRHMETVAFTYQKIRWTWLADGIEYEDDWRDPSR